MIVRASKFTKVCASYLGYSLLGDKVLSFTYHVTMDMHHVYSVKWG